MVHVGFVFFPSVPFHIVPIFHFFGLREGIYACFYYIKLLTHICKLKLKVAAQNTNWKWISITWYFLNSIHCTLIIIFLVKIFHFHNVKTELFGVLELFKTRFHRPKNAYYRYDVCKNIFTKLTSHTFTCLFLWTFMHI